MAFRMDVDKKVLSYGDSLLRCSDVNLLENGQWLNDKLIGFVFEYFESEKFKNISKDISLISPEVAQFAKMAEGQEIGMFLEPLNLGEKKFVLFPINDNVETERAGGSHWSLLLYCQNGNRLLHFDSMNGANIRHAKMLQKNVGNLPEDISNAKIEEMKCPQQSNGYDCGMHVICYADEVCKAVMKGSEAPFDFDFTSSHVQDERLKIKNLIVSLSNF